MSSILKVDQIQSDTGVMNLSSGLVYIDQNNRRVGIGNTSPSQILEITDTAPRLNFISTNNDSGARYNTDGTATNSHRWQYQGVTQMGLTSGGTLDLPYGQIKFPATQNASSDPNTLDDYEEGTWTPTVYATSGTPTYNYQEGYYTKIGRQVFGGGIIGVTNSSSLSGGIVISNLPFSINFGSFGYASGWAADGSGFSWPVTQTSSGNVYALTLMSNANGLIFVSVSTNATVILYTSSGIQNSWYSRFGFSYYT